MSVIVRGVPSALATIKGLKGLKDPKGIAHSTLHINAVRCPVPVLESDSVRGVPSVRINTIDAIDNIDTIDTIDTIDIIDAIDACREDNGIDIMEG